MAFDESVTALLKTYDNCLSLLKAFKRQKKHDGSRRRSHSRASEKQALLKRSLRANREKVERAYSSRVSEAGTQFAKGDSKAQSALGKVLKRLNAAITSLIRLASHGRSPALDYQSLMSLSNSSRLQAIKAFDQLSHRLDTKSSRGSVVSSTSTALVSTTTSTSKAESKASKASSKSKTSAKSTKSSSSSKPKKSRQGSDSDKKAKSAKESNKADPKVNKSRNDSAVNDTAAVAPRKQSHVSMPPPPPPPAISAPAPQQPQAPSKASDPIIEAKQQQRQRHVSLAPPPPPSKPRRIMPPPVPPKDDNRPTALAAAQRRTTISTHEEIGIDAALRRSSATLRRQPSNATNRFSVFSISSGSTRLGEIPQRKWRRNLRGTDEDEDEWDLAEGNGYYTAPVVYPLKPYEPPVKERRFLGLFKRGNTA